MVLFVNFSAVFHLQVFSFHNYVSYRYVQLRSGIRVTTFLFYFIFIFIYLFINFWKGLPTLFASCSFCGYLIVFVCLSL